MNDLATTTAIVSGAISALKNARDLVVATSNSDLRDQINQALEAVTDLRLRLADLHDENRELRAALAKKEEIVGPIPPFGYFYKSLDQSREHPLCPKCYQTKAATESFMGPLHPWSGGLRRVCRMCSYTNYEKEMVHYPSPGMASDYPR